MLRALERLFGFDRRREQLSLDLETHPRNADELRSRLIQLGLDPHYRCRLTSNRTVFVSYSERDLRLHRGYLDAPESTLRAIVGFVEGKSRAARRAARRELLEYDVHKGQPPESRAQPVRKVHPDDERMTQRLCAAHQAFNRERFGGSLATIPIRVSRRMKSRLGHYTHRDPSGAGAEIVISRRHIRRHGWNEALETLVHEMVHQWQDENSHPVDHGRAFRTKARTVGIAPRARSQLGKPASTCDFLD
jgi:hypothetical protein